MNTSRGSVPRRKPLHKRSASSKSAPERWKTLPNGPAEIDSIPLVELDSVPIIGRTEPSQEREELIKSGYRHDSHAHSIGTDNRRSVIGEIEDFGHDVVESAKAKLRQVGYQGWRKGAIWSFIGVCVVFIGNFITLCWAVGVHPPVDGIGSLYGFECDKVNRLNTFIHVLINVASTCLLAGSNYCMQRLMAPTRAEVDKAHQQSIWLDIGVPSVRNWAYVQWRRRILWILLGFSSLPLHLFYNSAISHQIATNDYKVYVVQPSFFSAKPIFSSRDKKDADLMLALSAPHTPIWRNVSNADCINSYASNFPTSIRSVVAVAAQSARNDTADSVIGNYQMNPATGDAIYWLCNFPSHSFLKVCDPASINSLQFETYNTPIAYCYIESTPERCQLQYSSWIFTVVVVANFVKGVSMFLTIVNQQPTLVTIGDAIESFLRDPDPMTKDGSFADRDTVSKSHNWREPVISQPWVKRRRFYLAAPGWGRWILCNLLCLLGLGLGIGWFVRGNLTLSSAGHDVSLPGLQKLGFGSLNTDAFVNMTFSFTAAVILANIPQLIFSTLYFAFNSILTAQQVGREWDNYGFSARSLRVTQPLPGQRSTYFLSLPYRWALPLMGVSGLLHWLLSQSLFLVDIAEWYEGDGNRTSAQIYKVGYSPIAIFAGIVTITGVIAVGFGVGFRRYSGTIPMAASCSGAISAACHRGMKEGEEIVTGKLRWGAVEGRWIDETTMVVHCSFSGREDVRPPKEGELIRGGVE